MTYFTLDKRAVSPTTSEKRVPGDAAQQRVQVRKLAALALMTHPDPFLRVPSPRPVEEEENVVPGTVPAAAAVFFVQFLDPGAGELQQRPVLGERFLVRIPKIGQQAEVQSSIPVREKPDFQRLDQILDVARAGEQGRDDHQSARCRRDAFREVHSGQCMRRDEQSCQPVHQPHCQLTDGQQREDADRRERPVGHTAGMRFHHEGPGEDHRDQHDGTQIEQQGEPARRSSQRRGAGKSNLGGALEFSYAPVDEVEADVPGPIAGDPPFCAARANGNGLACDLTLGQRAPLRYPLRCVAVAIAGAKIHAAIDAARIREQCLFDDAQGLDERAPVDRAQHSEAADAVADGDLIRSLLLVLRLHHLLDRQIRFGESLLDPGQRQRQGGTLSLQTARELRDKRARHRRARSRHVCGHQDQTLRVRLGSLRHLICPGLGQVSLATAGSDAHRDATEILDDGQPQHDGDRPQLAELESRDGLVGRNEAAETLRVHAAVAMRNDLQRDVVHARAPGRRSLRQAREFQTVTLGQVSLGRADLLFDEIEVVEEPFRGRRDPALGGDRRRQQVAYVDQHDLVCCQPRQELVRRAPRSELVRGRKGPPMLLHLIGAEQLRS